ncbi:single-stranded DNA-binding protein [Geosmithia morbida]|uniref:Single-stranded DNA-binding protein n=1 Tax=Geosmithia morbida TaxID=1094350 RepID=A0A9P5D485_9HYPO|nr:single-stranded DNA-binding protein [Geosmithia morbida]KAF4121249.1 single-stranded DNA-binding protein [Geosmithia morbida]
MSSSMLFRRAVFGAGSAARSFSTTSPRSIAKISIIGHLADTPELHQTSTGREVVRYAVASNSGPKDNRQTSWFRVGSFVEGPRRDFMLSLPKGSMIYVEGDAALNSYQDAEGNTRSALNITQRSIEVLKRPTSSNPE